MAVLNSVGFLMKVRSVAKYSAEDGVLQAIHSKFYILQIHISFKRERECSIASLA